MELEDLDALEKQMMDMLDDEKGSSGSSSRRMRLTSTERAAKLQELRAMRKLAMIGETDWLSFLNEMKKYRFVEGDLEDGTEPPILQPKARSLEPHQVATFPLGEQWEAFCCVTPVLRHLVPRDTREEIYAHHILRLRAEIASTSKGNGFSGSSDKDRNRDRDRDRDRDRERGTSSLSQPSTARDIGSRRALTKVRRAQSFQHSLSTASDSELDPPSKSGKYSTKRRAGSCTPSRQCISPSPQQLYQSRGGKEGNSRSPTPVNSDLSSGQDDGATELRLRGFLGLADGGILHLEERMHWSSALEELENRIIRINRLMPRASSKVLDELWREKARIQLELAHLRRKQVQ